MTDDLAAKARTFAQQTGDLLNGTVTDGIRISAVASTAGHILLGRGVSKKQLIPDPIPIAPSGKPRVWLYLVEGYELDHEQRFLATSTSTMSIYSSEAMASHELVVGVDYTRNRKNQFPACHLHVAGERGDLDQIYIQPADEHGRKSRQLRDLHLPVGGRRFRPTLEDLIEFMVSERMVEPRAGWDTVVNEHRDRWEDLQTSASARRRPEAAATALQDAGWTVHPPQQD